VNKQPYSIERIKTIYANGIDKLEENRSYWVEHKIKNSNLPCDEGCIFKNIGNVQPLDGEVLTLVNLKKICSTDIDISRFKFV